MPHEQPQWVSGRKSNDKNKKKNESKKPKKKSPKSFWTELHAKNNDKWMSEWAYEYCGTWNRKIDDTLKKREGARERERERKRTNST